MCAAAIPGCARCASPATRGPRIRAATLPTPRSVLPRRPIASPSPPTGEHAMKRRWLSEVLGALTLVAALSVPAAAEPDRAKLFATHCASCHGADRLGGQGPALLPENLGRMMGPRAVAVIAEGRVATQMPGFAPVLAKDEIAALATYISTPLP